MNAVLYVVALALLYAVGYTLNARTPKPEGCDVIDAACNSCSVGICSFHPNQQSKTTISLHKEDA